MTFIRKKKSIEPAEVTVKYSSAGAKISPPAPEAISNCFLKIKETTVKNKPEIAAKTKD
ncbi:MAG: hypothetical protein ACD_18C00190G0001 [uncultured bacterium]|nr:MAG: hypothetical protein ACD_18C00190G0001 [uncultured bacterium]